VGIRAATRRNRLQWCQALRFLEQPGPVVALASFPGSGNTWVRYLLQQVTGGNYRNVFISGKTLHLPLILLVLFRSFKKSWK
jgi:hypothetical protein